jgi:TPP-dependent pyruvate/acetoin dehydrogenase alpha subunit
MFRQWLLESLQASEAELEAINNAVAKEIEAAVVFAEQSPDPEPDDYARYIFA